MNPYKILVAIGYHAVNVMARLGTAVLHFALNRLYGPPQLAGPNGAGTARPHALNLPEGGRSLARDGIETPDSVPLPVVLTPSLTAVPPASERVCTAQLVGPHDIVFGVMWLYLYPRLGIARRVLKVTDPPLAKALGRNRFEFKEVPIDPVTGSRGMLDRMHAECMLVLDRRKQHQGGQRPALSTRRSHRPVAGDGGQPPLRLAAAAPSALPVVTGSKSMELLDAAPGAQAASAQRHVRGDEYQGVVTTAGLTVRKGPDGGPYRTYCLTVNDGIREVPLFGMELERQACDQRIRPGDRVRVIYMGREPLQLPGQSRPSYKNLYQLTRMESTS